ncbi:MAG TPA: ATP-binding protein [Kiritimatiellia bacterium]|nr:ATP-binding protein [Kiritimatiellia bacterium]HSA18421.1 ATP-binding protein [Kiritimatiellia bacterium]
MTPEPVIHLYTQDDGLVRRSSGLLADVAVVRPVVSPAAFEELAERSDGLLALVDLRAEEAVALIRCAIERGRRSVIVALGVPGSEPVRQAEALGVYAVEDLEADRARIQHVTLRAAGHHRLLAENDALREEAQSARVRTARPAPDALARRMPPYYPGSLCPVGDVESLLQTMAEDVAASVRVSRVGIFCRARDSETFKWRGGLRCLEGVDILEYRPRDDLVRWMARHAHLVSRDNLSHVRNPDDRYLLQQTLHTLGAEILLPLQARGRLLGWLYVGHRVTGLPFEAGHLEDLAALAEHVSTTLENALLYEELAVQKTLADTLLQSIPTGIVAVDAAGAVRWFNDEAWRIFGTTAETVLNRRIEELGPRAADLIRRALAGEGIRTPEEWSGPGNPHVLTARAQRLESKAGCLGAVLFVQDITAERALMEKQGQVERAAFWAELAAGMSHEIRNPLVAIKTFAQLLPERYEEAEFRHEFSGIVSQEVDRLNRIIDHINRFAHPPRLTIEDVDIREVVAQALELVRQTGFPPGIPVGQDLEAGLWPVRGDLQALAECVMHLLANSLEAARGRAAPRVELVARNAGGAGIARTVSLSVRDNGPGIEPGIRDKVFSPFCTTKARGMGLGLAIVQRVVLDHNGSIQLETGEQGTCVTLRLPAGAEPLP